MKFSNVNKFRGFFAQLAIYINYSVQYSSSLSGKIYLEGEKQNYPSRRLLRDALYIFFKALYIHLFLYCRYVVES